MNLLSRAVLFIWTVAILAQVPRAVAANDSEVAAHRVALELAGAWSNDGFKLRDGSYTGTIKPEQGVVVQVNLYAGNQYWFSVGATEKAKKMAVTVYDESGFPVEADPLQEPGRAAAAFSPPISGPYYVLIEMLEGEPATFCLVYSYK